MYADGVDKSLTHSIPRIRQMLNTIDPESELYWFFMGNIAHIGPDYFAHAGRARSFIVSHGLKHHLSEVIVDSLATSLFKPTLLRMTPTLKKSLSDMNVRFINTFNIIYPVVYFIAKLPLYKLLPKVQNDKCPKDGFELSLCNFKKHYEAMLEILRMAYPKLMDEDFTDLRMQEMATALVFEITCCQPEMENLTNLAMINDNCHIRSSMMASSML